MECSNVRTFYEMYSDKLRNFQGENGVFFKKLFQKTFKRTPWLKFITKEKNVTEW